MTVRKAVIPVAGFGTRFLPATRSVPKVMFPVVDRPSIQFAAEEAVEAGIERVIFVVSPGQEVVGRYFDSAPALEQVLESKGDEGVLEQMRAISGMADVSVLVQEFPRGLGDAVLTAKDAVGGEPFAVILPDDLIWGDSPTLGGMLDVFSRYGGSVVAVNEVPAEAVPSKGIIAPVPIDDRVSRIEAMVEKPSLEEAPSHLAIIGRYVLTPGVFDALGRVQPGAIGEVQLTDAIAMLLSTEGAYAYEFPGRYLDVGTPMGLLKASVYAALEREDLSAELREWISEVS